MKLLAASGAIDVVHAMHKAGILQLVVRPRTETERFARLAAIEAALGEPPDALTRLAALAVVEPEDTELLSEQLRLSNAETSQIAAATAGSFEIDPNAPKNAPRAALYKLGANVFSRAVRLAWARSGKPANDPHWRALTLLPDRWKAPTMPFSGSDVLALGIAPGPKVGTILRAFEDWWIKNNFPDDAVRQGKALKELAAKALT
jgi:poly(A) polymerase